MRLLVGLIFGVLLTVAGAYVHDTAPERFMTQSAAHNSRPIVNWDVLNSNLRSLQTWVGAEWRRLRAG